MSEIEKNNDKSPVGKIRLAFYFVLFLILFATFTRLFLFEFKVVSSTSMEPTLVDGDLIFVSKVAYDIFGIDYKVPKRNDVIVFDLNGHKMVKRIYQTKRDNNNLEIYVLGDNAMNSIDSREFGFFNSDQIVGKVIFKIDDGITWMDNKW